MIPTPMSDNCRLVRVLTALMSEPWMLTPEMHRVLTDIARSHAFGGALEREQHAKAASYGNNPAKREFATIGSTAIIPCDGVVGRKFANCLESSGVVSIDIFERLVNAAADDDGIDSILLNMDTPGGTVTGVPEAAAAVARASEKKPVIAYCDGMCASAGYYIASQATLVYAMPSSQVGSVGVYMALLDMSRYAEMQGLKVELFKSGENKGMGQPGTSLTDKQRAMLQAKVDKLGAQFRATVVQGRKRAISADDMQGQCFDAQEAKNKGFVDEICSFEQAFADAAWLGRNKKG